MKSVVVVAILVLVSAIAWQVADKLSADALGMAIGVLFGVCAGIPAALLMLASSRRREYGEKEATSGQRRGRHSQGPYEGYGHGYMPQPPVIVLAGNGMQGQMSPPYGQNGLANGRRDALPAPPEAIDVRQFRVVGEREEWVDEW